MLNRVTNLTMSANAQRTLQTQQSRLSELQEKATTLNKISRPSDDPAATAKALETRSLLAATAQYGRNIDDGNTWLTAADSALEQATNVMHRIKDLTVLAGNGSLKQSGKDAIAIELEALNKALVSSPTASTWAGTSLPATRMRPVRSLRVRPGTPASPRHRHPARLQRHGRQPGGTAHQRHPDRSGGRRRRSIFGDDNGSVFDTVANWQRNSDRQGYFLAGGSHCDVGLTHRQRTCRVGTRQAQLERAGTVNTELEAALDAQRTGIEKADLGSVIMDLKLQETNYQVALAATARVLQPTLMDFLR